MAHHGQQGCSEDFYKTIKFRACLWPTPTWVWNNDAGGGINTAHLKTFDTRRWMDEIGQSPSTTSAASKAFIVSTNQSNTTTYTTMKRRDFLRISLLGGVAATVLPIDLSAKGSGKSGFTLWQIPSQINTIGNSYVFLTDKGRVVVMDGGVKEEAMFLKGFLAALGNEVEAWFISHPHDDHMGALNAILENPGELKIKRIYHSRFSNALSRSEQGSHPSTEIFYAQLDALDPAVTEVIDLREPGLELKIDGMNLKILGVTNEEFAHTNPYNNSSMIIRVWDKAKSIVFLGDAGIECGDKVLNSAYRNDLDCDYLQVAHHGQQGLQRRFL